jgi:hypothetical protein
MWGEGWFLEAAGVGRRNWFQGGCRCGRKGKVPKELQVWGSRLVPRGRCERKGLVPMELQV